MVIGALKVRVQIMASRSLKDKRRVVKSLKDRLKNLNVAVAEVEDLDKWQAVTLGIASVSNDTPYLNALMDRILDHLGKHPEVEILETYSEYIHV